MADIEKIVDNLNLPKQILDKSESLLKTLFGPSFDELGGMIADQVRLRRFKNQLTIFSKAQEVLKKKNIDPKKVSLKILAPLIEYSSYEEEPDLQEKWSSLTAHILIADANIVFQQNCITILNKISTEEASLLDKLYHKLHTEDESRYQRAIELENKYGEGGTVERKKYSLDSFTFDIVKLSKELKVDNEDLSFKISSLISLGLLKWETDVEVTATKSYRDPDDNDIDVDVGVSNNDIFIFTPVGYKFVEVCKTH